MESQSSRAVREELCGDEVDAAFALQDFDADGADVCAEGGAECGDVVEGDELDAGHDGLEGLAVERLCAWWRPSPWCGRGSCVRAR